MFHGRQKHLIRWENLSAREMSFAFFIYEVCVNYAITTSNLLRYLIIKN